MEYHLRVDITKKLSLEFSHAFIAKFKPDLYCITYEIAKITKKEHIHMYLKFDLNNVPPKSSLSDYMKKKGYSRKYSFAKQKKSTLKHLLYILKDENPILSNLNGELMDDLMEKCSQCNLDRKLTIKEKYYNYWLEKATSQTETVDEKLPFKAIISIDHDDDSHILTSDFYIFNCIMEFVFINDLLPPNKSQMHQYIQYIILKIINIHTDESHHTNIDKKFLMFSSASGYGVYIPPDAKRPKSDTYIIKTHGIFNNDKYYLM